MSIQRLSLILLSTITPLAAIGIPVSSSLSPGVEYSVEQKGNQLRVEILASPPGLTRYKTLRSARTPSGKGTTTLRQGRENKR